MLTGFNFEIDLAVWQHRVIVEPDRFYIGILRPDGAYHFYHGVNRNGNVGTLLYVHGSPQGAYQDAPNCITIADLTEQFICGRLTYEQAREALQAKRIVYAPDSTMQAVLSDQRGRTLIVEPGIGWREEGCAQPPVEESCFSLMTNYSLLAPESTRPYLLPGDDRYERAAAMLSGRGRELTIMDAFAVLRAVKQEGIWATRVSFVYSAAERTVFYVQNNQFGQIKACRFEENPPCEMKERS